MSYLYIEGVLRKKCKYQEVAFSAACLCAGKRMIQAKAASRSSWRRAISPQNITHPFSKHFRSGHSFKGQPHHKLPDGFYYLNVNFIFN